MVAEFYHCVARGRQGPDPFGSGPFAVALLDYQLRLSELSALKAADISMRTADMKP